MPILRSLLGSKPLPRVDASSTSAGVSLPSPERSLQISAVYACIRLLSESIGTLPVGVFEKRGSSRRPIEDDRVAALLTESPNETIDAGEFWRTMIGWMALRGNGYAYLEFGGNGRPMNIWPLQPSSVQVKRRKDTGGLMYKLTPDTSTEYVPVETGTTVTADRMMHLRAFGLGVEGLSPIGLARESVGISFAAQQYIGGFFARDASPGGVLTVPGSLTDEQYQRLETEWKSLRQGVGKSHELAVLEAGARWEKVTLSPADAQFLEVQKFSRGEIASIYGVPPHMIGDVEKSTSWGTGIEQQGIGFIQYSLTPWMVRCEKVAKRILGKNRYLKWNVAGLLRGDTAQRYQAYAQGRQWGWLSANDIRRMEDQDPIKGGDAYLSPLNMVPSTQQPTARSLPPVVRAVDDPPAEEAPETVESIQAALVGIFERQRAEAQGTGGIDRDVWDPELAAALLPLARELAGTFGAEAAEALEGTYDLELAAAWLEAWSEGQASNINFTTAQALTEALAAVGDDEDPVAAVDDLFDGYSGHRSAAVAVAITAAVGWFARTDGSKQAGATHKTWNTGHNPRRSHARMNGQTVKVDSLFSNGMRWPHDYRGGVDEVAGCNCGLSYSTEEE